MKSYMKTVLVVGVVVNITLALVQIAIGSGADFQGLRLSEETPKWTFNPFKPQRESVEAAEHLLLPQLDGVRSGGFLRAHLNKLLSEDGAVARVALGRRVFSRTVVAADAARKALLQVLHRSGGREPVAAIPATCA